MEIYRIVESMMKKSLNIGSCVKNNYSYTKHRTRRYQTITSEITLQNEIAYYQSTASKCQWNENKIVSLMLGINVPCSHQIFLGAVFPECSQVKLVLNQPYTKLIVDIQLLPDADDDVSQESEDFWWWCIKNVFFGIYFTLKIFLRKMCFNNFSKINVTNM